MSRISPEIETLIRRLEARFDDGLPYLLAASEVRPVLDALRKPGVAQTPDLWRPFETAPKDGTPFLCWSPDEIFQPITGIDLIWWETSLRDWTGDGDKPYAPLNKPTLWRPLPAPPQGPDTSTDRTSK